MHQPIVWEKTDQRKQIKKFQKCKSTQRGGRGIYANCTRTAGQTLTVCQKSFPFLQQLVAADWQQKSCVDYAQKIMHNAAHSQMKIKSMRSFSFTVISFSLSINKGDVPRVYVAQAVFCKISPLTVFSSQ